MKNKGREIEEFGNLLDSMVTGKAKITTHYATVTEVNWEEKTATVKGLLDNLEFFDVLLGLGSINIKPKIGSLCLIGIILNNDAQSFLISAREIDGCEIVDSTGFKLNLNEGRMTFNGESFGGIVKAPELKQQIDKNSFLLERIQQVFSQWVVVPNDGGSALKSLSQSLTILERANLNNITNDDIKHGDGS